MLHSDLQNIWLTSLHMTCTPPWTSLSLLPEGAWCVSTFQQDIQQKLCSDLKRNFLTPHINSFPSFSIFLLSEGVEEFPSTCYQNSQITPVFNSSLVVLMFLSTTTLQIICTLQLPLRCSQSWIAVLLYLLSVNCLSFILSLMHLPLRCSQVLSPRSFISPFTPTQVTMTVENLDLDCVWSQLRICRYELDLMNQFAPKADYFENKIHTDEKYCRLYQCRLILLKSGNITESHAKSSVRNETLNIK